MVQESAHTCRSTGHKTEIMSFRTQLRSFAMTVKGMMWE